VSRLFAFAPRVAVRRDPPANPARRGATASWVGVRRRKESPMQTDAVAGATAETDAKKRRARARKPHRGIFEKVPGSGVFWIRYTDSQGRYRREVAGTWSAARRSLHQSQKRRTGRKETAGEIAPTRRAVLRTLQRC
jgi:hypothetical protein